MTIHLTEGREQLIHSLMKGGRYASEDEVIAEALRLHERRDRDRAAEKERVEALLIEGLESGPSTPMTPEDWDDIAREGRQLIAERKGRGR